MAAPVIELFHTSAYVAAVAVLAQSFRNETACRGRHHQMRLASREPSFVAVVCFTQVINKSTTTTNQKRDTLLERTCWKAPPCHDHLSLQVKYYYGLHPFTLSQEVPEQPTQMSPPNVRASQISTGDTTRTRSSPKYTSLTNSN